MVDPATAYSELRAKRRGEITRLELQLRVLGYWRLVCVAIAAVIVWMVLATQAFSIAWVIVPIAMFTALMIVHDKRSKAVERLRRAERHFTRALD